MKQIEISLDWHDVETELRELTKTAPEFRFNVIKFCNSIQKEVRKLADIEIDIRRRPTDSLQIKHREKAKEINEAVKLFTQTHLMHLFTRVD